MEEHTSAVAEHQPDDSPRWTRARSVQAMRAFLQALIVFPLMAFFAPITLGGKERIRTLRRPAIFVSNHSSALDAVVMLQAMPARFRYRCYVVAAADSIYSAKWKSTLTQLLINTFPIPRAGGARPALEHLKAHLAKKWSVVIFPEGRLSRTGRIGTFKKGAAILAVDAGIPVVPAFVDGTYEVLPRFRRFPRRHDASIVFGDPLMPAAGEDYDTFIGRVEQAVRALAGPKGIERDEPAPAGSTAEGSNYWY